MLIDTHLHLDLYKLPSEIIQATRVSGIRAIAVTNAPFLYRPCCELVKSISNIKVAAGLHPELVSRYGQQIDQLIELLSEVQVIGEIGLDYSSRNEDEHKCQRKIFSSIIEKCAELKNKVLSIHSRRAVDDIISCIGDKFPGISILHWFNGSFKQLDLANEYGFWFSVNSAMIKSESGNKLIKKMPLNRILLESDGPFIKENGIPVLPSNLFKLIKGIADCRQESMNVIERQIKMNQDKIFRSIFD
jgi:TatD DNase family protein